MTQRQKLITGILLAFVFLHYAHRHRHEWWRERRESRTAPVLTSTGKTTDPQTAPNGVAGFLQGSAVTKLQQDTADLRQQIQELHHEVSSLKRQPTSLSSQDLDKITQDVAQRVHKATQAEKTSARHMEWRWFPEYRMYLFGYEDHTVDPPVFRYNYSSNGTNPATPATTPTSRLPTTR